MKTLSCGCCDQGCVCAFHQDVPNGNPEKLCDYHREHGHPHVTQLSEEHWHEDFELEDRRQTSEGAKIEEEIATLATEGVQPAQSGDTGEVE